MEINKWEFIAVNFNKVLHTVHLALDIYDRDGHRRLSNNLVTCTIEIVAHTTCSTHIRLFFSDEALITEEDLEDQAYVDYDAGGYSPKLLRNADLEIDTIVYDPTDDMRKLELARQQVLSTGRVRVRVLFLDLNIFHCM